MDRKWLMESVRKIRLRFKFLETLVCDFDYQITPTCYSSQFYYCTYYMVTKNLVYVLIILNLTFISCVSNLQKMAIQFELI